jgi:dephospho-CoA kinase
MHSVANDLRKTNFSGFIISELLNAAKQNGKDAVIESVRSIGELELLRKEAENFYLFAVNADPKLRYERIAKRGKSTDHVSFEKFIEDERKELVSVEIWNMNINQCMAHADFMFENNGTLEELYAKVDEVLEKIRK